MALRKVGIRDVAKLAGVSLTTVSHVLNAKPETRVTQETASRVQLAAQELGYIPNRMARGLRKQSSDLLGLVAEEIAVTPYAGKILLGAQEEALRRDYTLAIINAELSRSNTLNAEGAKSLIDRDAAGVIFATVYHDVVLATKTMLESPSVIIGAREEKSRIDSICPDEQSAAQNVIQRLVEMGHQKIGFAAASDDVPATQGRIVGYQQAMESAGLSTTGLIAWGESNASGGYLAASELLKSAPTAIFCYNDRMAMGVYRAAFESGIKIPTDLSIVGFDDQSPIPESLFPELSTVALPHYEMGVKAVELLVNQLENPDRDGTEVTELLVPCPFIDRKSVAEPRKSE